MTFNQRHQEIRETRAFNQRNQIAKILFDKMQVTEDEINFPPERMFAGLGECYHSLMKAVVIDKCDDIEFLTLVGEWDLLK